MMACPEVGMVDNCGIGTETETAGWWGSDDTRRSLGGGSAIVLVDNGVITIDFLGLTQRACLATARFDIEATSVYLNGSAPQNGTSFAVPEVTQLCVQSQYGNEVDWSFGTAPSMF